MADETISAGQVSLSVVPNSAGFSEKIVSDLSDRLGYVGGVLGDTALGTLKKFAAPLAALAASLSVKKVVDDSISAFSDLAGSVKSLQRVVGGSTEEVSGLLGVMRMSGIDSDRCYGHRVLDRRRQHEAYGGDSSRSRRPLQVDA